MGLDDVKGNAKSKVRDKVIRWYAEEKRLRAQVLAARATLRAARAGDSAVSTATRALGPVADQAEPIRGFTADQVASANEELVRLESELARVRAKLRAALKAKRTGDSFTKTRSRLRGARREAAERTKPAKD